MTEEILHSSEAVICGCSACSGLVQNGGNVDAVVEASLDPQAGGTYGGRPILTADEVSAWLNRTGTAFNGAAGNAPQSDADNSVINFGFFNSTNDMLLNGYTYVWTDGVRYAPNGGEIFNFAPFTADQRSATREAITAWDDVIAVSFRETHPDDADINLGNLANAPTTQAYATLPYGRIYVNDLVNSHMYERAGDVWISASQASNFRLDEGMYGIHTLVHELGHSLGLSHPGTYNGTGLYSRDALYAQDTRAYSVMSYFEASVLGARHFDFNVSTTVYAATPLIHDIAAAQRIYGADMTTRTGDTVYGFNSNAGRDSYDFSLTPAPIMAIWDAGGIDTIDASGYATDQIIDLAPGSLSSIGGVTYETAPSFEQVNLNRAAAGLPPVSRTQYDANMAALKNNPVVGRLTDNVGIAYGATIENAIGGSGNDSLLGNNVDNVLRGMGGNDIMGGGIGDDTLDGGTGIDQMLGGVGNDLYIVGEDGDLVIELVGEGIDSVQSSIDYTLVDHVENLALTGSAVRGTGNALDNLLVGNGAGNVLNGGAGNDRLIGGDGIDRLIGGVGKDTFVAELNSTEVATKRGSLSLDMILDFSAADGDKIDLSNIDFNGDAAGNGSFNFVGKADGKAAGDVSWKSYGNVNAAEAALGYDIDGVDGPGAEGPVSIIFGHTDNDGTADFALVLFNTSSVTTNDLMIQPPIIP